MISDIAMGLIQARLHEKFGPGYDVQVMQDSKDERAVLIRIRKGNKGEPDAIACNARMLWYHLPTAISYKSIQSQVEDAIYGEANVDFVLTEEGINTCDHVFDNVTKNKSTYAWNEKNNLE